MGKYLVALDTNHIKQYVFATDRLKDIRGASSILDELNRKMMEHEAEDLKHEAERLNIHFKATAVYTNGGSGMFLIEGEREQAEELGRRIQKKYSERTKGGSSVSLAIQKLPDEVDPWSDNIQQYLKLLTYRLVLEKAKTGDVQLLPSHPLLRPCDSCGMRYAEVKDRDSNDPNDQRKRYCASCRGKRREDEAVRIGNGRDRQKDEPVRKGIDTIIHERIRTGKVTDDPRYSYIWRTVLGSLPLTYAIPPGTERPSDFNELRNIAGGKDYLALIYADGNGMGKAREELINLKETQQFARNVDESIYKALGSAISEYLAVIPATKEKPPMFPFDILMIGGDDVMLVTPAPCALDVAYTIAKGFHKETNGRTLSVSIILAPIKYPFRLLHDLAESTLKFAKKEGEKTTKTSEYDKTRINFLVVAGSTSHDFKDVYDLLHAKDVPVSGQKDDTTLYATLRPYKLEDLKFLLEEIRDGKGAVRNDTRRLRNALGRTKLHQIREAVLHMNMTTSITESLAVLRNWNPGQRDLIVKHVYAFEKRYKPSGSNHNDLASDFPRVTFPWFADGSEAYRTPLLDFVELYDFVMLEGDANGTKE